MPIGISYNETIYVRVIIYIKGRNCRDENSISARGMHYIFSFDIYCRVQ